MSRRVEDVAEIVQITFDRVFDVQGRMFSFESGGRKEYGVSFSDGTVPRDGSRYAVALVEDGNWQKVIGWRTVPVDGRAVQPEQVLGQGQGEDQLPQRSLLFSSLISL